MWMRVTAMILGSALLTTNQTPGSPAPMGVVPSARQLAWHDLEFYGFIHFTTNTVTD